jgi:Tol biopolymer transport system component
VVTTFPPPATSEGIVILEDEAIQGEHTSFDVFLLDMATGAKTKLAKQNESLADFAISPDRKRMAYERVRFDKPRGTIIDDHLVIATADGQVQKTIPWEKGWVGIPGWLDDERLVINMAGRDPDESTANKPATFLMLNPFTGERRILRPDFPDIYAEYPVIDWERWSETVYDPTLTRVVYLSSRDAYVLWDLESNRALATLSSQFLHPPRWSPDGTQFVVAANPDQQYDIGFELFSISRDGQQITPLTNLRAYSPADMWSYSWSPDGSRLAFWLSTDPQSVALGWNDYTTQRLAVLDLTAQTVTDYCIPLDEYTGDPLLGTIPFFASGVTSPIWSPNGQQLIVESRYAQDASRVILVDVVQGFAVQIAENMMPAGWMKSAP